MKTALLILALLASGARAQENDYESSPGLIPVGGLIVFYNSQGPLSFVTMTRKELPPYAVLLGTVKGRSCQYGLSVPISPSLRSTNVSGAKGNGGYEKALADIRRSHPDLAGIYDVQVDVHTLIILGIYRRACTEISARGFK